MTFLAPLFLAALAGLAIPVLLHLTQREKKQIIRFPSLMFVRRIPYQSVRRRKIHNWLLLFIRMAALALLIAAFARPLIPNADTLTPAGEGARELVVLLDTSYSMSYGNRWEQARQAAQEAVSGLSSSDRGSVVLFSSNAEIAVRTTGERDRLDAAVATAKPTAGATRYTPALKVAGSILRDSKLPRREVRLISDYQKNGWRGEEGARLPAGATITPVPVTGPLDRPNAGVTGVTFARSLFNQQERAAVTVGLVNRTEQAVNNLEVKLTIGGIPARTKPVNLPPSGTATVTFDPFTVNARNMRGTVSIPDDGLLADNQYNFVLSPARSLRVILLDRGNAEQRRYLTDALNIGDAPKFETIVRAPEAVTDEDLRTSAVVVANDLPISSSVGRRLRSFVENGGGLFLIAGARASWPGDVDLLPATLGAPVDRRAGGPARVGALEYGHPVFEPFRAPRSGNFAAARIYNLRTVTPGKDAEVLARFDTGSPAAIERRLGTGRVLQWASGLDRDASDLPLNSVFPIFVRQAMRHLASYQEPQESVTVGFVLNPATAAPRGRADSKIVLTPSGNRLPLDEEGSEVLALTEQGFYEMRSSSGAASDVTVIAANVDPAEGDLTPLDQPNDIAMAVVGEAESAGGGGNAATPLTPDEQENNQRLWWYLLCAGLLLLGVDTVLSNRLAKT